MSTPPVSTHGAGYSRFMATSPAVARNAVLAQRQAAATDPPHPAVWQPWEATGADAAGRLKIEMSSALSALDARMTEAGRVLDLAYATAAGPAAQMRAAAYAAFDKYMNLADELYKAIMDPAVTRYDQLVSEATSAYQTALADATKTYKAALASATAAKTEAASIKNPV